MANQPGNEIPGKYGKFIKERNTYYDLVKRETGRKCVKRHNVLSDRAYDLWRKAIAKAGNYDFNEDDVYMNRVENYLKPEEKIICEVGLMGGYMEDTAILLKEINSEIKESKKVFETLSNEVKALNEIVNPLLLKITKDLRDSRMAVTVEMKESLNILREVRKFFFEADYNTEMERLERFVKICKEIQKLKADGVFDAVCDSAIRLAIKKEGE